jgi:hypothetical protein
MTQGEASRATHALAPIGRHQDTGQIPDSPTGFLESSSWRGYFAAPAQALLIASMVAQLSVGPPPATVIVAVVLDVSGRVEVA